MNFANIFAVIFYFDVKKLLAFGSWLLAVGCYVLRVACCELSRNIDTLINSQWLKANSPETSGAKGYELKGITILLHVTILHFHVKQNIPYSVQINDV